MAKLFEAFTLRGTTFRNRAWVSPMCQYSAVDGMPNDWHFVHLGSRAVGGAGLVLVEATAVSPEGRITPGDTGIWNAEQVQQWRRINGFAHNAGVLTGLQLAHAGRKASTEVPWEGSGSVGLPEGGWETVGPSAIAFEGYAQPRQMTADDIVKVRADFVSAAGRALEAEFDVIELHSAHGYLLHQFLSPLSNQRLDEYGGSFENRVRLLVEIAHDVRRVWPEDKPLFVRLSATDWVDGGWSLEESVELSKLLTSVGVDLVDCSSGGLVPDAKITVGPGYQVPFANRIKNETDMPVAAVGMITTPDQAESILENGEADAVLLARAELWDPYWPAHAAHQLGAEFGWPNQYARAVPRE